MSAPTTSVQINVELLRQRFGSRQLLDLRNVAFESDRIHLIAGDNGAGKSTLLRILALLHKPDALACSLQLDGHVGALNRRDVTYVHQQPYLLSQSVHANLAYGLIQRGVKGQALRQALTYVIEQFDLARLLDRSPPALSGGERMKIALARGVATGARVILIDEPTANLDAQARRSIFEAIMKAATDVNTPRLILITTHDVELLAQKQLQSWHLVGGQLMRS